MAIPAREPWRRAMTSTKESLSGRRNRPRTAASSPKSSDRPRIRGDFHPSDPLSHCRKPVRDPSADDVEEPTLQDEKKRDNSKESPIDPINNPVADHTSLRPQTSSRVTT